VEGRGEYGEGWEGGGGVERERKGVFIEKEFL